MKKVSFPKEIKIGNRTIGVGHPAYLIAEIGANFDQNIEKAKRLIVAAKEAGADCAKFQTFSTPKIVSEGGFSLMKLQGVHGSWGRTVSEVFKDAEFPREWHQEISSYWDTILHQLHPTYFYLDQSWLILFLTTTIPFHQP